MCKIVLRYALYHRVASSPPALFLPLAFSRPLLSPLYSPSSALSLEHVSSGYCQYLPLCSNFSHFSFPLDLPRVFLLDHLLSTFLLLVYLPRSSFLRFSYFSIFLFFALIFLSRVIFPSDLFVFCPSSLLLHPPHLFMPFLFSSVSFFFLPLPRRIPSLHIAFLERIMSCTNTTTKMRVVRLCSVFRFVSHSPMRIIIGESRRKYRSPGDRG